MMTLASLTMILGTWTNTGVLSLVWFMVIPFILSVVLAYHWGKSNGELNSARQARNILLSRDMIEYTEKKGRWNYYWKDSGQPFNL